MNVVVLFDLYIRVKIGEVNMYNIMIDYLLVINEIWSVCCKWCFINLCCFFVIVLLIEGMSVVERVYVIKVGSDRSGNV